jgi:hypothetical protein
LPDKTRLTAWLQDSKFYVEAFGTGDSIAEIGELLGWLGAALRPSPYQDELAYSTPVIRCILPSTQPRCKIEFVTRSGSDRLQGENGQCWQNMFRNPVVVDGYPILKRLKRHTGMEISLDIMAALAGAQRVTNFLGKIFIKGFCTMLIPTDRFDDMVIWHLLFHEDGRHISYNDPRICNLAGPSVDSLCLSELENLRHIVGWCSNMKNYAGKRPIGT